ncbi:hypothetical protein AgCh_005934 [Apium graveolens]
MNPPPSTYSFQAHTRDLEAELHVLKDENARLQQALIPRPYNEKRGGISVCFPKVDRVYLSTEDCIAVIDHGKKRTIVITKGLPACVNFETLFTYTNLIIYKQRRKCSMNTVLVFRYGPGKDGEDMGMLSLPLIKFLEAWH